MADRPRPTSRTTGTRPITTRPLFTNRVRRGHSPAPDVPLPPPTVERPRRSLDEDERRLRRLLADYPRDESRREEEDVGKMYGGYGGYGEVAEEVGREGVGTPTDDSFQERERLLARLEQHVGPMTIGTIPTTRPPPPPSKPPAYNPQRTYQPSAQPTYAAPLPPVQQQVQSDSSRDKRATLEKLRERREARNREFLQKQKEEEEKTRHAGRRSTVDVTETTETAPAPQQTSAPLWDRSNRATKGSGRRAVSMDDTGTLGHTATMTGTHTAGNSGKDYTAKNQSTTANLYTISNVQTTPRSPIRDRPKPRTPWRAAAENLEAKRRRRKQEMLEHIAKEVNFPSEEEKEVEPEPEPEPVHQEQEPMIGFDSVAAVVGERDLGRRKEGMGGRAELEGEGVEIWGSPVRKKVEFNVLPETRIARDTAHHDTTRTQTQTLDKTVSIPPPPNAMPTESPTGTIEIPIPDTPVIVLRNSRRYANAGIKKKDAEENTWDNWAQLARRTSSNAGTSMAGSQDSGTTHQKERDNPPEREPRSRETKKEEMTSSKTHLPTPSLSPTPSTPTPRQQSPTRQTTLSLPSPTFTTSTPATPSSIDALKIALSEPITTEVLDDLSSDAKTQKQLEAFARKLNERLVLVKEDIRGASRGIDAVERKLDGVKGKECPSCASGGSRLRLGPGAGQLVVRTVERERKGVGIAEKVYGALWGNRGKVYKGFVIASWVLWMWLLLELYLYAESFPRTYATKVDGVGVGPVPKFGTNVVRIIIGGELTNMLAGGDKPWR